MAEKTYEINIPGIGDTFRFGAAPVYDKALKRQRYERMKAATSPVPETLRWIPRVIQHIDDAQDMMYTAAYLGKFLLRRVAPRFIPYVGWALLAMDAANLLNGVLGMAMTPGVTKPDIYRSCRKFRGGKKAGTDAFERFTKKGGWHNRIGFALQAAQVSQQVTGYGISLGAVMGCASEFVWGGIKGLQGERVRLKGPPPADPVSKAARYVSQNYIQANARDILSIEDHALLMAANNLAVGILLESGLTPNDNRMEDALNIRTPLYEPWETSSLEMLAEEGITDFSRMTDYTTENDDTVTIGDAIMSAIAAEDDWQNQISPQIPRTDWWSIMYDIWEESGRDTINWITGTEDKDWSVPTDDLIGVAEVAKCNIMLAGEYPPEKIQQWINEARLIASALGNRYPRCPDWRQAAARTGITLKDKA